MSEKAGEIGSQVSVDEEGGGDADDGPAYGSPCRFQGQQDAAACEEEVHRQIISASLHDAHIIEHDIEAYEARKNRHEVIVPTKPVRVLRPPEREKQEHEHEGKRQVHGALQLRGQQAESRRVDLEARKAHADPINQPAGDPKEPPGGSFLVDLPQQFLQFLLGQLVVVRGGRTCGMDFQPFLRFVVHCRHQPFKAANKETIRTRKTSAVPGSANSVRGNVRALIIRV